MILSLNVQPQICQQVPTAFHSTLTYSCLWERARGNIHVLRSIIVKCLTIFGEFVWLSESENNQQDIENNVQVSWEEVGQVSGAPQVAEGIRHRVLIQPGPWFHPAPTCCVSGRLREYEVEEGRPSRDRFGHIGHVSLD